VPARRTQVLSAGRNPSRQSGDPTDTTLHTTLSPRIMCANTVVWPGIGRVIVGDGLHCNGVGALRGAHGVETLRVPHPGCIVLFERYLSQHPEHSRDCRGGLAARRGSAMPRVFTPI
jgi:tRNA(Arg) A34 adenosine deaminase TadA